MESKDLAYFQSRYKDELEVIRGVWQNKKDALIASVKNSELLMKDDGRAKKLKEIANDMFKCGKVSEAIKLYSNALYIAEYNGELFGTILANISACNYELGFWDLSVCAVDMCLKSAYPKQSFPKVYIRKIKGLARLGEVSHAKKILTECINCINGCKLTKKEKDKLIEDARTALKTEFDDTYFKEEFLEAEMEENPNLQNASKKATLCYNKEYGRHIIAKEDIKRGECILIKRPYVEIGMYSCANCYKLLNKTIIPCMVCTTTAYCSETCRDRNKSVHKWECKLYLLQCYYPINVRVKVAFRAFLKGLESGYKVNFKKIEEDLRLGKDDDFSYFQQLHSDFKFLENSGHLMDYINDCCIIMAYLSMNEDFMNVLKIKEFFGSDLLLVGRDILHYSLICDLNCYRRKDDKKHVGMSLSYSFLNHSCVPNTESWSIESIDHIKALQNINAGEQIFVSYLKESKDEHNSATLRDTWNIICNCAKCKGVVIEDGTIMCPQCNLYGGELVNSIITCNYCKRITRTPEIQMQFFSIANLARKFIAQQDICILMQAVSVGSQIKLNPNSKIMQSMYFDISKNLLRTGKFNDIEKYLPLTQNLTVVEFQYNTHQNMVILFKRYIKLSYNSSNKFSSNLKKSTLNCFIEHMDYLKKYFTYCSPNRSLLLTIDLCRKFFSIQRDVLDFNEHVKLDETFNL